MPHSRPACVPPAVPRASVLVVQRRFRAPVPAVRLSPHSCLPMSDSSCTAFSDFSLPAAKSGFSQVAFKGLHRWLSLQLKPLVAPCDPHPSPNTAFVITALFFPQRVTSSLDPSLFSPPSCTSWNSRSVKWRPGHLALRPKCRKPIVHFILVIKFQFSPKYSGQVEVDDL